MRGSGREASRIQSSFFGKPQGFVTLTGVTNIRALHPSERPRDVKPVALRTRPSVISHATVLMLVAAVVLVTACSHSAAPTTPKWSLTRFEVPPGLAGVGVLPARTSAWPEAGYDARRSSATLAVGPQTAAIRWRRELGGDATPGPVLAADGSIVAATNAGRLYNLDARTGTTRWVFDADEGGGGDLTTSPAVVAGGVILYPGSQRLYALSPRGRLLWSEPFAGQVLSPAVAGANRVYVADMAGHLTALEVTAATHRRVWRMDLGGADYASASVGPDGSIYTAADHDLVAVRDLGDKGAELWRFHSRELIEVSSAVGPDGTIAAGTNANAEYGIGPDGSVRWSIPLDGYTYSSSIAHPSGVCWFGDNVGNMRIIDTASGRVQQIINPRQTRDGIWSAVAADAHGNAYWGTTGGYVYGYAGDGHQLFELLAGESIDSNPALGGDGTLYIATRKGTLYAIGA